MAASPRLVGIAGPSGSGKTTLARRLVRRLGPGAAVLVSLDSYYRDLSALDPGRRARVNFDSPRAIDRPLLLRHLRALSRGRGVEVPVYGFGTHTRAARGRRVVPASVVVVEGLFVLSWKPVRELLRLKVFVETDRATCLARRIARDAAERGRTPSSVRRQFEATVWPTYERWLRPACRHADLVVDGSEPVERLVGRIAARLTRRRA